MAKVLVSVTNDLVTDNRVDKVCRSIMDLGFEVLLIGRVLPNSLAIDRPYATKRMRLVFSKGALFYAEFNLRLFFFLLFKPCTVLHSNDLDTLLPNTLIAKIRGKKLVYDTHEYFTEVPEIQTRPLVKRIWLSIEKACFALPNIVFTVNGSIAAIYAGIYKREVLVMRNIPTANNILAKSTREKLGLPTDKFILILQGSGINVDRGAEEMLKAMCLLPANFYWLILGNGDVVDFLKQESKALNLSDSVRFLPRMPYAEMMQYSQVCDLGLSLDKPTNINYELSLPNKLFDYVRAEIPVLASNLKELAAVIEQYQVGWTFNTHTPDCIANKIKAIYADNKAYNAAKANTVIAKKQLAWENEVVKLRAYYASLTKRG